MLRLLIVENGHGSAKALSAVRRVLLLGPDDEARRALHLLIDRRGLQVVAATELATARKHLASADCDVVMVWPELAAQVCKEPSMPPVIAVLRTRDLGVSLSLIEAGVDDIVADPLDDLAITLALRHVSIVPRRATMVEAPPSLIGDGEAMHKLKATIALVAATRSTVLILGESGTGKELVARAIHDASPRRSRRFVAINCAAIPAPLLESELFGHVRGAFTDAVRDKPGLFEDADGGTLFLDEVGELQLGLQVKLLRALQESEIRRVGDTASIKVDVRLIAATLRDLREAVEAGRFRQDLFYRLNVLPVEIPPLRDRAEDIPQLARLFAARHAVRHRRAVTLSDAAIEALARQAWHGNVRELENVIERALVLAEGPTVDAEFLGTLMKGCEHDGGCERGCERDGGCERDEGSERDEGCEGDGGCERDGVARQDDSAHADHELSIKLSIKKATRSLEQDLIRRALGVTAGNRTNAAKLLEISHRALLYKMKEYGIS